MMYQCLLLNIEKGRNTKRRHLDYQNFSDRARNIYRSSGAAAADNEKGKTKKQTAAAAHYSYTNSFSRILPHFQAGKRSTKRRILSKPIIYSDAGTFQ